MFVFILASKRIQVFGQGHNPFVDLAQLPERLHARALRILADRLFPWP